MYLVVVDPQVALYRYLEIGKRMGYHLLVLAKDPIACRAGEAKYNSELSRPASTYLDELIQCDTSSASSILTAVLPFQGQIAGFIPGDDPYVPATFEAGRVLGFDYALPEDAVCQQLKTAMKRRMADAGVRTADFRVARSLEEAEAAWEFFGRDCMVKMVDYSASANVYRVTTHQQLVEAWEAILSNRWSVVVPFPLAREAILEEFIDGSELSAEGYIQGERIVILNYCEKVTETNFVVVGHLLPALLSVEQESVLEETIKKCVRALGIRNSVFHIEVHMRQGLPYVIECAARPPGQHIVELISRCYGHDLMEISIAAAAGKSVSARRRKPRRHYALFALYPKKSGLLGSVEGAKELRRRGGMVHWHLDVQPGDRVEALASFRQRYGFVILEDQIATGVREKARWMRENVRLVVA